MVLNAGSSKKLPTEVGNFNFDMKTTLFRPKNLHSSRFKSYVHITLQNISIFILYG